MAWLLEWPCSLGIGREEAVWKPQSFNSVQPSLLMGVSSAGGNEKQLNTAYWQMNEKKGDRDFMFCM